MASRPEQPLTLHQNKSSVAQGLGWDGLPEGSELIPGPQQPLPSSLSSSHKETNARLFNILLMISNKSLQQRTTESARKDCPAPCREQPRTPTTAPWNVRGRKGLSPAPVLPRPRTSPHATHQPPENSRGIL